VLSLNRHNVICNKWQGDWKKVLCVCGAGCLRAPTAAVVLAQPPYSFNTRSCGLSKEFAIIPIDEGLLVWADEIVCFTENQKEEIEKLIADLSLIDKIKVIVLDIPDNYPYRDTDLISMIKNLYGEIHA